MSAATQMSSYIRKNDERQTETSVNACQHSVPDRATDKPSNDPIVYVIAPEGRQEITKAATSLGCFVTASWR